MENPPVIPLPQGATATLWTRETIPNGRRKPMLALLADREKFEGNPLVQYEAGEVAIRCLVESWTVLDRSGQPLPTPWERREVLDEIPAAVFDALVAGTAPYFTVVTPDLGKDPKQSAGNSTTPAIPT